MPTLPPPPTNDQTGSYAWLEWFRQLRNYIATVGSVPWNIIDFSGSTISDIANRAHNLLQSIQGGSSGEYYHLTATQHTDLTDGGETTLHTHTPQVTVSATAPASPAVNDLWYDIS